MKTKVYVELQLFTMLFKCLNPDDIGDNQHPVSMIYF